MSVTSARMIVYLYLGLLWLDPAEAIPEMSVS